MVSMLSLQIEDKTQVRKVQVQTNEDTRVRISSTPVCYRYVNYKHVDNSGALYFCVASGTPGT